MADFVVQDVSDLVSKEDDGPAAVWTLEQPEDGDLPQWIKSRLGENYVVKLVAPTGSECCTVEQDSAQHDNGSPREAEGSIELSSADTMEKSSFYSVSAPIICSQGYKAPKSHPMLKDNDAERSAEAIALSVSGEGVLLQSNNLATSPDLNLKALLQMLEKNSDTVAEAGCNSDVLNTSDSNSLSDMTLDGGQLCSAGTESSRDVLEAGGAQKPLLLRGTVPTATVHSLGVVHPSQFIHQPLETRGDVANSWSYSVQLPGSDTVSADETGLYASSKECFENDERLASDIETQFGRYSPSCKSVGRRALNRSKRGRRRKPIRQFHSELFMRPYFRREQSPQLQLVKLVRQKSQNEDEKAALALEQMVHEKEKLNCVDNPELAFMKTIDMPSGKRVEDIYVVPSVWISDEKKQAPSDLESQEANLALSAALAGEKGYHDVGESPQMPLRVYQCEGHHGALAAVSSSHIMKNSSVNVHQYRHILPSSFPLARRKILSVPVLLDSQALSRGPDLGKGMKGHIITTLNAPKLEPVPTLRDLCRAALGFREYRLGCVGEIIRDNISPSKKQLEKFVSLSPEEEEEEEEKILEECSSSRVMSPKEFLDMKEDMSEGKPISVPREEEATSILSFSEEDEKVSGTDPSNTIDATNGVQEGLGVKPGENTDSPCSLPGLMMGQTMNFVSENPLEKLENKRAVPCDLKDTMGTKMLSNEPSETTREHFCLDDDQEKPNKFVKSRLIGNDGEQNVFTHEEQGFEANDRTDSHNNIVIPVVSFDCKDAHPLPQADGESHNPVIPRLPHALPMSHHSGSRTVERFDITPGETATSTKPDPSVVSITKQIKHLSCLEPLNKPLADLAATLNVLCNAERTLCNADFAAYRQVKGTQESRSGSLNMCILRLGEAVVTVGNTLQAWAKDVSGNRCFKTIGILTDSYNTNIVTLIDLITPYFHHICELIANCRMDPSTKNKHLLSAISQDGDPFSSSYQDSYDVGRWCSATVSSSSTPAASDPPLSFTHVSHQLAAPPAPPVDGQRDGDWFYSLEEAHRNNYVQLAMKPNLSRMKSPGSFKIKAGSKRGRPTGSKNCQKRRKVSLLRCRKPLLEIDQNKLNPSTPRNVLSVSSVESSTSCEELKSHNVPHSGLVEIPSENFCSPLIMSKVQQQQQPQPHTYQAMIRSGNGLCESLPKPDQMVTTWTLPVRTYCSTGDPSSSQHKLPPTETDDDKSVLYQAVAGSGYEASVVEEDSNCSMDLRNGQKLDENGECKSKFM
ncbi:uncharacterized protein LOC101846814 [Aplysia californica]|uniref:Uncharacterized protein LOC101846814 n=1 Tax=Aplysia californica TaxID=6500 RepID=A0ABM1VTJ1_APLCA|nr:uncharacterized protein LOC101846814 [Aplysia californica]